MKSAWKCVHFGQKVLETFNQFKVARLDLIVQSSVQRLELVLGVDIIFQILQLAVEFLKTFAEI